MSSATRDAVALGIDIGGTGIKGGLVDTAAGEMIGERFRLDTPQPATVEAVAETVEQVAESFDFDGPVGLDFPGVVIDGVVHTAANVDDAWIGTSLAETIGSRLRGPASFLNDADAAALAEARFGAGRGVDGLVVVVTFGTGIGIGLVHTGVLIPNAELGHIEIDGEDAELSANAKAREREELSWEEWGARANRYLTTLERLLNPRLYVLGGGISKKPEKWSEYLRPRTPLKPAELINNAGIVGAGLHAHETANG